MKRIMIFDDDTDILEILTYLLKEKGWEVYTQTTCDNIIEAVADRKPDIILMDNWIPGTGGVVATQTLKQHPVYGRVPVVYFSANNDIEKLSQQAGADAYLAKPFDLDELEEIISQFYVE